MLDFRYQNPLSIYLEVHVICCKNSSLWWWGTCRRCCLWWNCYAVMIGTEFGWKRPWFCWFTPMFWLLWLNEIFCAWGPVLWLGGGVETWGTGCDWTKIPGLIKMLVLLPWFWGEIFSWGLAVELDWRMVPKVGVLELLDAMPFFSALTVVPAGSVGEALKAWKKEVAVFIFCWEGGVIWLDLPVSSAPFFRQGITGSLPGLSLFSSLFSWLGPSFKLETKNWYF